MLLLSDIVNYIYDIFIFFNIIRFQTNKVQILPTISLKPIQIMLKFKSIFELCLNIATWRALMTLYRLTERRCYGRALITSLAF